MNNKESRFPLGLVILIAALVLGQALSYVLAPDSWRGFTAVLPKILSMIAFWGPIVVIVSFLFVMVAMRLLGFKSIQEIRRESIEDNNPTPAIVFVGTLIASILFLLVVIRP
jgi:heme/copper-type cytochrome/quinol oxidase subunit 2